MKQFSTTVQLPETTVKRAVSVGTGLGARLGVGVGCIVGLGVGSGLGAGLGVGVGCIVGLGVGSGLGLTVGAGLGFVVGRKVGRGVGNIVGFLLDLSMSAQQRAFNSVTEATQVEYQSFLVVASAETWPVLPSSRTQAVELHTTFLSRLQPVSRVSSLA